MRFFMVDKITHLEPGVAVRGVKNVSVVEEFLTDNGFGRPTLPPPLLIESLAQLGVWLVAAGSEFRSRAVLLSLGEVLFDAPVHPGDQLLLENWVEARSGEAAVISGQITVGDAVVMQMRDCMCAIVPAGDLDDASNVHRMYGWLTADLAVPAGR
jgi:3-hydroxyacyl-[acyl-carrier-protein] dehydratase